MVVTDLPLAATVRRVQLFIETPSTCTTHAPHCDVSQPICVPVRLSVSRRNSDRSSEAATSAFTCLPLTDISTFICASPVSFPHAFNPLGSGSSQHPRLVLFPPRQHDVADGEGIAVEDSIWHIGDQLIVADVVQH